MLPTPLFGLRMPTLAILTVAVGAVAIRLPTEFWLGVITAATAFWLFVGTWRFITEKGRCRAFWAGFVLVSSAALFASFGPWSDSRARARWPDPQRWPEHSRHLMPATRFLINLIPLLRPQAQAAIAWHDARGDVETSIAVSAPFDCIEGLDPLRDQVARLASRLPLPSESPAAPPQERIRRATELVTGSLTMANYQAIGHMLTALTLGWVGGAVVRLGLPRSLELVLQDAASEAQRG